MHFRFQLIILAALLLSGCAPGARAFQQPQPASSTAPAAPADTLLETYAQTPERNTCPVSQPVVDQPPDDPNADPFGAGEYYINADRTLWTAAQHFQVGGHKTAFIRPAGADLQVSGRRLDGEAPPLHFEAPCCYPTGFQVGGLYFPEGGCWEVVARAGESELRFITWIEPAAPSPAQACDSLEQALKASVLVVYARVQESTVTGRYAWLTLSVNQHWKGAHGAPGYSISVMQDLQAEPALQAGGQYILFLAPGHWRLLCPQHTVVEVQGQQGVPLGDHPFWEGGELGEWREKIRG